MARFLRELILPAGMLSALIIGAGVFSLPYLFYKTGVGIGFIYLALFSVILSAIHLMYGEVVKQTKGDHRFLGYAKIYLGNLGFYTSFATAVIGIFFSLLIYLVLSIEFINALHDFNNELIPIIIFWTIATMPILFGIKKIADLSFVLTLGMIAAILAIFFYGLKEFPLDFLVSYDISNLYLPYGAVLFSLSGRAAISAMKLYFDKNNLSAKMFNFAIMLGTMAPAVLYALFIVGVLGIAKGNVSSDAISSLTSAPALLLVGAMFAILSIWTSYIFLGFELKYIFMEDIRIKKLGAELAVIFLPILLYFAGLDNFIMLVSFAGAVFLAVESILVVLMWLKLKNLKKRAVSAIAFSILLICIFLAGAFHEILYNLD